MSALPVIRKMRIIALPLTAKTPTRDALTYYHFITRQPEPPANQGYLGKAQAKASSIWAGFGKAEGGWKLKTFTYGEKLIDRLDYEELALSGLDPTLGPKLSKFGKPNVEIEEKNENTPHNDKDTSPIALIHPKFYSPLSPLDHLNKLLDHRTPKHKRGAITWTLVSPLTAPFAILPIIPNLPFFFCVWRAWTHWKAFKASDYLLSLLKRNAIASEEDDALDAIYAKHSPSHTIPPVAAVAPSSSSPSSDAASSEAQPLLDKVPTPSGVAQQILLTKDAVPEILELYQLPESAASEMYRAIEQARQRTRVQG